MLSLPILEELTTAEKLSSLCFHFSYLAGYLHMIETGQSEAENPKWEAGT